MSGACGGCRLGEALWRAVQVAPTPNGPFTVVQALRAFLSLRGVIVPLSVGELARDIQLSAADAEAAADFLEAFGGCLEEATAVATSVARGEARDVVLS
jgi:hypothetical protein